MKNQSKKNETKKAQGTKKPTPVEQQPAPAPVEQTPEPEVKDPVMTTKEHTGHGVSYYKDGVRVFNIKTRRGGKAIVFFTKKAEVEAIEGLEKCTEHLDSRYAAQYIGDARTVLEKAYEAVGMIAPEEEKSEAEPETK